MWPTLSSLTLGLIISRLTHGPAYRIFDRTNRHLDVGCEALRARLPDFRPRLHLVGHIHEAHGAYIHAWNTPEPPSVQSDEKIILKDNLKRPKLGSYRFCDEILVVGGQIKFGGSGFQPVVVDLKE